MWCVLHPVAQRLGASIIRKAALVFANGCEQPATDHQRDIFVRKSVTGNIISLLQQGESLFAIRRLKIFSTFFSPN
jgi:hypothetical protein